MGVLVSDNWGELIEPLANRGFWTLGYSGDGRLASFLPSLFNMQGSTFAEEKSQPIGGMGSTGWNFEDSGRVQYGDIVKGYEETFAHHEFARGVMVERKLFDDARWSAIQDQTAVLGDAAFRVREKAGSQIFANAFSAATSTTLDDYGIDATGPDAVALCSDAHPRPGSATTDDNEGTLALTTDNVATVRGLMMDYGDLNGEILNVMPDEILVPPELEDTALTIVRSVNDPDTANNAINPQAGRFRVMVWHYLTDANAWFMMDSGRRRQHLRWYDRIPLEFAREQDFDTLITKFRAYMRFSLGWTDWRWIYGNNPS
jgi:hypothetical protein